MNNIIILNDHRPHYTGPVRCPHCNHFWTGVYLVETDELDCPECNGLLPAPKPGGYNIGDKWQCSECLTDDHMVLTKFSEVEEWGEIWEVNCVCGEHIGYVHQLAWQEDE